MGVSAFFCCFEDRQPKCLASTGIASSILAFAFFIWGITDLEFKRNWIKAFYIVTFVIVIILIVAFIALFILVSLPKSRNYRTIMNYSRIICLIVLVLTGIAFVFLILSFIFLLIDYGKLHNYLKDIREFNFDDDNDDDYEWASNLDDIDTKLKIVGHEWGAVIAPSVIGLIVLVIIGLVANYLYRIFTENYNSTDYQGTNSNQNTVGVITPNMNQPELLPNNNGPVPPMGNNINNPPEIKQN